MSRYLFFEPTFLQMYFVNEIYNTRVCYLIYPKICRLTYRSRKFRNKYV